MGSSRSRGADAHTPPSPGHIHRHKRLRDVLRVCVLGLLITAPLAIGSVQPGAYIPMLVVAIGTGAVSWARALYSRSRGDDVPLVPGRRLLLALHLVVLLQLLPLPAGVVKVVSPGSHQFHTASPGGTERAWMTITASPPLTRRGLMFLFGMTLLYGTAFREFREHRWRRRMGWALVVTGTTATVVGLVQMHSANPTTIYGIWRPQFDWAVFGPYVGNLRKRVRIPANCAKSFSPETERHLCDTGHDQAPFFAGRQPGGGADAAAPSREQPTAEGGG